MARLVFIGRIAFGFWMFFSGIDYFFDIFPQVMGATPVARQFTEALIDSGLFPIIKAIEVVAGLCIMLNFYTPLMLMACLPLSIVIFYWDVVLDRELVELIFGPLVLLVNGLLMLAYFDYFKPMLTRRAIARGEGEKRDLL